MHPRSYRVFHMYRVRSIPPDAAGSAAPRAGLAESGRYFSKSPPAKARPNFGSPTRSFTPYSAGSPLEYRLNCESIAVPCRNRLDPEAMIEFRIFKEPRNADKANPPLSARVEKSTLAEVRSIVKPSRAARATRQVPILAPPAQSKIEIPAAGESTLQHRSIRNAEEFLGLPGLDLPPISLISAAARLHRESSKTADLPPTNRDDPPKTQSRSDQTLFPSALMSVSPRTSRLRKPIVESVISIVSEVRRG